MAKKKTVHDIFRDLVRNSGLSLLAMDMAEQPEGQFLACGEEDQWIVMVATRGAVRDTVTFLEEQADLRSACFEAQGGIVLDGDQE